MRSSVPALLLAVVAASALLLLPPSVPGASARIQPFELSDVSLGEETLQARAAALNQRYLIDVLDLDRLLWSFRTNAKLDAPGTPYLGSWEDPTSELRGHFVGHYMSALALAWRSTGAWTELRVPRVGADVSARVVGGATAAPVDQGRACRGRGLRAACPGGQGRSRCAGQLWGRQWCTLRAPINPLQHTDAPGPPRLASCTALPSHRRQRDCAGPAAGRGFGAARGAVGAGRRLPVGLPRRVL